METFQLSKDIFKKLADISKTKIIQSSNTDEIICEFIEDKNAKVKFFNGTVYEGPILGGKLHGNGVLRFADKTTFCGNFEHNRIQGPGQIHYSELEGYKGEFEGFSRHGIGCYWHHGLNMKYEGNWENDLIHGKGVLKVKDKWTYRGKFVKNKKHGLGELKFVSGTKYKGQFKDDQKHGKGSMFWINPAEVYHGEWTKGRLEGFGIYIYQNNFSANKYLRNHYRGFFKNGQRDGLGVHFYSDGSVYLGEWKNNNKHGIAIFLDSFGEKFQMNFDLNRRITDKKTTTSLNADKRLGFVLDLWKPHNQVKHNKKNLINFILNFQKIFKEMFKIGMKEFVQQTEQSRKLSIIGVLKLMQKMKIFNRKGGTKILEWIVKHSEHNFIFTGYNKLNIKVDILMK